MRHDVGTGQQAVLHLVLVAILRLASAHEGPVGTHVPVDVARAASLQTLVHLLCKRHLLLPVGQALLVVGDVDRVLRHPYLLAVLLGLLGGVLQVHEWRMTVDVAGNDVHLITCRGVVEQFVGILRVETQRLGADEAHAGIGFAVEHVGIVLHEVQLFVGRVEAAAVAHPPVGLVLHRHGIDVDTLVVHPLQERVQPGEELVVAVLAQLAALVALVVGVATLGRAVGLILAGRRPRGAKDDAASLLHDLCRRQRAVPVVGCVPVVPLGHLHVALEVGRNLHAHDVQPDS